ncbi:MAG: hypothetical protein KBC44_01215 [Candidatus Pacebacteria bacterium]|nr:hypothetical protein [Candidatus Paceibacterota bacterium]MBP9839581.1 hypothetical protein [Candidatus Paceibacterota bacterium]
MEALKFFFEKRKHLAEKEIIDLFPGLIVVPSSLNVYKLNKQHNQNSIQLEFKDNGVLFISFLDWRDEPVRVVAVNSVEEFYEFHDLFERYMAEGIRHFPLLYNLGKNHLFQ